MTIVVGIKAGNLYDSYARLMAEHMPRHIVRIRRAAFDRAITDPQLLVDAKRRGLEIIPTPAAELAERAREVMAAPPEIVGRIRQLLGHPERDR